MEGKFFFLILLLCVQGCSFRTTPSKTAIQFENDVDNNSEHGRLDVEEIQESSNLNDQYPIEEYPLLVVASPINPETTRPGERGIYLMNLKGKLGPQIIETALEPSTAKYSPDCSKIVFHERLESESEENKNVFSIFNLQTLELETVTYPLKLNGAPEWSPNGKEIVFAGSNEQPSHLFRYKIESNEFVQLTQTDINRDPSWSSDGKQIVYISALVDPADVFLENRSVHVMDTSGLNKREVIAPILEFDPEDMNFPAIYGFSSPKFSPDGKKVIIEATDEANLSMTISKIYLFEIDNPSLRLLVNVNRKDTEFYTYGEILPTWSPDGQSVLFYRGNVLSETDNGQLCYADVETGNIECMQLEENLLIRSIDWCKKF